MADFSLTTPFSTEGSMPFDFTLPSDVFGSLDYTLEVTSVTYTSFDYTLKVNTNLIASWDYTLEAITGVAGKLDYTLEVTSVTYGSLDYPLEVSTNTPTSHLDYTLKVTTRSGAASLDYTLEVSTSPHVSSLDYTLRVSTGTTSSLDYTLSVETRDLGSATYIGNSYLPGLYTNHSLRWSLKVLLDNQDISYAVAGAVKITATINAARVADITITPTVGFTRPFSLTGKSVQIWYHVLDASGAVTAARLRFSGIVDTPSVDLATGITTLRCTDNLPKRANGMSKAELKELISFSSWSSFIFQKPTNNWAYVQDLLTTTPSAIYIPPGGNLVCRDLWVDGVTYTANDATIIDGSLTVNLPSLSSIVNSVEVNIDITKSEFKEQITSLNWQGEVGPPTGAACGLQQIFDAVSTAGAKFCAEPVAATPPPSRYYTKNFQTVAVINSGEELLCSSISGLVSRRFVQPTTNKIKYIVENAQSIQGLGLQKRSESYNIPVVLDKQTEEWFLQEETVTRWWPTASGLQQAGATSQGLAASTLYRPGNGFFEPYPAMSATFPIWISSNPLSSDIRRKKDESHSWTSSAVVSDPVTTGSFAIDTTAVTAQGTPAEIEEAILCAQAKARTTIELSHRTATTTFSLIGAGLLELCDSIYVSTTKVETKGVVTDFSETFDIDGGKAITQVTTASSLVQAVGLSTVLDETSRLDYKLVVTTVPPDYEGNPTDIGSAPFVAVSPSSAPPDLTQNVLKQYFYTSQANLDPEWYGHIAPMDDPDNTSGGQNIFVIPWPTGSDAQEAVINREYNLHPVVIAEDVFQLKY